MHTCILRTNADAIRTGCASIDSDHSMGIEPLFIQLIYYGMFCISETPFT